MMVAGKVQGVFYRASAAQKANELKIGGWVRNRSDGMVEILAEGEENLLHEFINWCHKGPSGAQVDRVNIQWVKPGNLPGFSIKHI